MIKLQHFFVTSTDFGATPRPMLTPIFKIPALLEVLKNFESCVSETNKANKISFGKYLRIHDNKLNILTVSIFFPHTIKLH